MSRPTPRPPKHARLAPLAAWLAVTAIVLGANLRAQEIPANPIALNSDTPTATEIEFFEKNVRPILVEHCEECHRGEEINGGLLLDSRVGWSAGGDSGPVIVPGKPDESLLITAVRYENRDLQMPPQNRLAKEQIAVLEKWVELGAPDPRVNEPSADAAAVAGMSIPDGLEFWSFQPLSNPQPPAVLDDDWVRTPIDAFILARLQEQGLSPAPPADRRTLIRRVTFDLTGLPPTPAEIDAFLADDSPEAFERVVERLLSSQRYGVRWGRHWLDVARYADSNGLDENLAFGNAWRYRDYVVNAFNNDKPFDRFLIEQIAGDLIPGASEESRIATGFLVLGAKVLAEPDREKLEMDTIDEQIDATGKAFLGMSLGCVRCHDHKFDPIKQRDYYALAAIFKSTKTFGDTNTGAIKHWHEHVMASPEELAAIKEIDAEIAKKKSAAAAFKNKAIAAIRQEARSRATQYLVAAAQFDPDTALGEVAAIAEPVGLHPRILHHCRLHLQYHADDPVFQAWHRIKETVGTEEQVPEAIRSHYGSLFEGVETALAAARKANPKANQLDDPELEAARAAIYDASGFLAVPPKPEHALDPATLAEYDDLMDQARVFESRAPDVPAAMGVTDGNVLARLPIHIRGSHLNLGQAVDREFPEVMRISNVRPVFPSSQSGRLELARWMADTRHPLTSRVYVNRIWRWHFGEGLVRTTENFGILGDRPSHPQLLDWLARRFMQSGWSTKELHRLILRSSVYQMASHHNDETLGRQIDPENRLWWKFRIQRLESEPMRDSILAIAGQLDESMGGKTVPLRNRQFVFNHTSVDHTKYDSLRRAVYLPVIRNNLYSWFAQFDFPDPTMPTGDRNSTVVAPQVLLLMNSQLVMNAADQFAEHLLSVSASDSSRVEAAYEFALGREPTEVEIKRALGFIESIAGEARIDAASVSPEGRQRGWSLFCQGLFASNEFIYLR